MPLLLLLAPFLGWVKSIFSAIIGTEVGRLILVALLAAFISHWRTANVEQAKCEARVEESRNAAAAIDAAANQEQLRRKEEQALAAEARANAQATQLEGLKNAVRNDCPLGDNADLLERLR